MHKKSLCRKQKNALLCKLYETACHEYIFYPK